MIILNGFKEINFDPRLIPGAEKFGKSPDKIDFDKNAALLGCIGACKFELFNVKKELIWEIGGDFLRFAFVPGCAQIWLVKKTSELACELLVYDYERNLIAKDELDALRSGGALVLVKPLGAAVAVEFDCGADGSSGFLARLENGKIKALPYGENVFLSLLDGERALFMSSSKNLAFIARASDLARLREINFDQTQLARDLDGEFLLNGIIPLSLSIWLVTSVSFASGYRHYVFDAQNLRFIDEAAIEGFLPYAQEWGYVRSEITALKLVEGKIAAFWDKIIKNVTKKNKETQIIRRYFTADFADIVAQILAAVELGDKG